jgi:hypothetical protein
MLSKTWIKNNGSNTKSEKAIEKEAMIHKNDNSKI